MTTKDEKHKICLHEESEQICFDSYHCCSNRAVYFSLNTPDVRLDRIDWELNFYPFNCESGIGNVINKRY